MYRSIQQCTKIPNTSQVSNVSHKDVESVGSDVESVGSDVVAMDCVLILAVFGKDSHHLSSHQWLFQVCHSSCPEDEHHFFL